jgi:hypothetical protein
VDSSWCSKPALIAVAIGPSRRKAGRIWPKFQSFSSTLAEDLVIKSLNVPQKAEASSQNILA